LVLPPQEPLDHGPRHADGPAEACEAELTWVRERFAEGYLAHLQEHIGVLLKQLAELGQRLLVLQHEATVDNLNRALADQKRPATFVRAPVRRAVS
jgi:hypothetical protein